MYVWHDRSSIVKWLTLSPSGQNCTSTVKFERSERSLKEYSVSEDKENFRPAIGNNS